MNLLHFIIFSSMLFLGGALPSSASHAQSSTTNIQNFLEGQIGGPNVKLDQDEFGRTRGVVGNSHIDIVTDQQAGHTTGVVGGGRMNIYTDQFGNTRGIVNGQSVDLQRRAGGLLEGTIDGKRVVCDQDPFGSITCKK